MLRSGFAEQFVEADVLLFIEAERVFITRRSELLAGHVCQFSVGIHNIGSKGVRLGRTLGLAERAPFVCRKTFRHTKVQLAVSLQKQKSAPENFYRKFENSSVTASGDGSVPGAILQPSGRKKKPSVRTGAVVSGHRNRGISVGCILQHERSVFLFRSLSRYKPHETENGILNGLKHKTGHTRFTTV